MEPDERQRLRHVALLITGRKTKWNAHEKIEGARLRDCTNQRSKVGADVYNFYSVVLREREREDTHVIERYGGTAMRFPRCNCQRFSPDRASHRLRFALKAPLKRVVNPFIGTRNNNFLVFIVADRPSNFLVLEERKICKINFFSPLPACCIMRRIIIIIDLYKTRCVVVESNNAWEYTFTHLVW